MKSDPLCVLITRPEPSGKLLAEHLNTFGICSICQPLFDYQALPRSPAISALINEHSSAIVIFVSVAAVEFAASTYSLHQWKNSRVIAVGPQTQQALSRYHIKAEVPLEHNSEGLLSHPLLASVKDQAIFIIRGDSGRELLKQTLSQRGALVYYVPTYLRQWRKFTSDRPQHWQKNEINCIVITSNAILDKTLALMNTLAKQWQRTCLWVVASERIAQRAKKYGILKIVNANGANNTAISTAIRQYGNNS